MARETTKTQTKKQSDPPRGATNIVTEVVVESGRGVVWWLRVLPLLLRSSCAMDWVMCFVSVGIVVMCVKVA